MLSQQSIYDLEDILGDSMRLLNGVQLDIVKQLRDFTQEKCYQAFTKNQVEYLRLMKRGPLGDYRQPIEQLEEEMKAIENLVSRSVIDQKMEIRQHRIGKKSAIEPIIKKHRMRMLQEEMHGLRKQLLQLNMQIDKAAKNQEKAEKSDATTVDESQALQNAKQFLKNLRKQKRDRKQHLDKLANKLQMMRQQEQKQEKEKIYAMAQQRKKQILQKSLQKESHRQAIKQQLVEHEHNFTQRMKSIVIHRRSASDQLMVSDQIKKTLLSRKQKLKLQPLECWQLEEHSKRYEEMRQKEDVKRKERIRKMVEEQRQKSIVRNSTSYVPEPKEQTVTTNKNLRNRVKQYEDLIRKHFVPKVDPMKRKQLQNMIEEIEHSGRHAKKTVLNNGSVILEEIKPKDPKIYGLQYLEESKLLINRKRKSFHDEKANSVDETHRQRPNYLTELRNSSKRSSGFSRNSQKIQKTKDYDEKVRLVQQETESLLEEAARKEAILKHGKFLTAEEMLRYKQDLDEHYLKIIRLKLKLIK